MSNSDNNFTVSTHGGVTHLQIGGNTDNISSNTNAPVKVLGSVHDSANTAYHLGVGSDTQSQRTTHLNMADAINNAVNPLDSATNNGFPAQGILKADSVIKVNGMELTIAGALAQGWVRNTADGYQWVGPTNGGAEPIKKSDIAAGPGTPGERPLGDLPLTGSLPEGIELFSPEVETEVAQAIEAIPQPIYDANIAKIVEGGIQSLESLDYDEIARVSGITTEQARETTSNVVQHFIDQADDIARSMGCGEPKEVWDWLEENKPQALKKAQMDLAFMRDTRTLRELITYAKNTAGASEASLNKLGFETSTNPDGELMVKHQGTWILASVAMRIGLI